MLFIGIKQRQMIAGEAEQRLDSFLFTIAMFSSNSSG